MYKILIVEDDETIAEQLEIHLGKWGYETARVVDFENILSRFAAFSPQLVLLDIGLPFYNGYYWCGEIRKVSQVPVVYCLRRCTAQAIWLRPKLITAL